MNESPANRRFIITSFGLIITSTIGILFLWIKDGYDISKLISFLLVVLSTDLGLLFYFGFKREELFKRSYSTWMILVVFCATFYFICFPSTLLLHTSAFFIGAVFLAYLLDMNIGLLFACTFFAFSSFINQNFSMDTLYFFFITLVLCMLVQMIDHFLSVLLTGLITAILYVIYALILNQFHWPSLLEPKVYYSFAFSFVTILLAYVVKLLYHANESTPDPISGQDIKTLDNSNSNGNNSNSYSLEQTNIPKRDNDTLAENKTTITVSQIDLKTPTKDPVKSSLPISKSEFTYPNISKDQRTIDEVIAPNFELLHRMRIESNKLYRHSKEVADLSLKVAEKAGVDSKLAYAGALYHEIGRLNGKDVLEDGLMLADLYHLPLPIVQIMKQYNYKNEPPQSIEAVIVMLSDNIITMYHFMKKQDKEVSIVKLIDNTFHMHFNKGTIEASGLTLNEYNQLRKSFLSELVFNDAYQERSPQ